MSYTLPNRNNGGGNPSTHAEGTSPGSFANASHLGGALTFSSPDTPGMPPPSEKTAWDFMPADWTRDAEGRWHAPEGFEPVTQLEHARLGTVTPEMRRVADYLDITVPEAQWLDVVERCTFAAAKKNPEKIVGKNYQFAFKGGADTFINKGTNGRWVGVLDEEDLALYDEAMAKLPADYAHWLENGGPAD